MPPASLIRKVLAYELSEMDKTSNRKNTQKSKRSVPKRIIINKVTYKRARAAMATSTRQKTAASAAAKSSTKAARAAMATSTRQKTATSVAAKSSTKAAKPKSATMGFNSTKHRQGEWIGPASSGRSKCRHCLLGIKKGQDRLVISRGSRSKYYHLQCVPEEARRTLAPQLCRQLPPVANMNEAILKERWALVTTLKTKYSTFLDQTAIYKLVLHLPRTETGIIAVVGKYISDVFDPGQTVTKAIWEDIECYLNPARGLAASANSRRRRANASPEIIVIDDSDDEEARTAKTAKPPSPAHSDASVNNGEVMCEDTLTCAQVIQKKFDQAEANGEIVTID